VLYDCNVTVNTESLLVENTSQTREVVMFRKPMLAAVVCTMATILFILGESAYSQ